MKNFFMTPIEKLTVLESIIYVVLCGIIGFVSAILALMLPQCVEKIWDWTVSTFRIIKKKLFREDFEEEIEG